MEDDALSYAEETFKKFELGFRDDAARLVQKECNIFLLQVMLLVGLISSAIIFTVVDEVFLGRNLEYGVSIWNALTYVGIVFFILTACTTFSHFLKARKEWHESFPGDSWRKVVRELKWLKIEN